MSRAMEPNRARSELARALASLGAAEALGMGTLAIAIRTVLVDKTPSDFGESIAAMTLQAMGVEHEEALRLSAAAIPEPDRR
ncbi:hypothetical protein [Variovorax sp. Sphag1AA]|uniref:hypothetical protein n=1 Tax=Variovorax sp. Sphag1AA TaxID=2587027 RepID=UPI00160A1DA8|nr:hypothetical protein [Variovorax sp. Sphag1AA]MBB3182039.1 hypothetical protein [Variovorax sp. Sphag1AA]